MSILMNKLDYSLIVKQGYHRLYTSGLGVLRLKNFRLTNAGLLVNQNRKHVGVTRNTVRWVLETIFTIPTHAQVDFTIVNNKILQTLQLHCGIRRIAC